MSANFRGAKISAEMNGNATIQDNAKVYVAGVQIIHQHFHECCNPQHHQCIQSQSHENGPQSTASNQIKLESTTSNDNPHDIATTHTKAMVFNQIEGHNDSWPIVTSNPFNKPFHKCLPTIFGQLHRNWKFEEPQNIILKINNQIIGSNDGDKLKNILQKIPLNEAEFFVDRLIKDEQIISYDHISNKETQSRSSKQSISHCSIKLEPHHHSLIDAQSMPKLESFPSSINNTTTSKKRRRDANEDNLPSPKRHKNNNRSSSFFDIIELIEDSDDNENNQRNDDDNNNKYVQKKTKRKICKKKKEKQSNKINKIHNDGYDDIINYHQQMMEYIMNNRFTNIGNTPSDLLKNGIDNLSNMRSKIDPDTVDLSGDSLNKMEFWKRICHFYLIKEVIYKLMDIKSQIMKELYDTDNFDEDILFKYKYNKLVSIIQEYNQYYLQPKHIKHLIKSLNELDVDIPDDMYLPNDSDDNCKENTFEVREGEQIEIAGCNRNYNDKRKNKKKYEDGKTLKDFYKELGNGKFKCIVKGCYRNEHIFNAYTTIQFHIKKQHLSEKKAKQYKPRRNLAEFYTKDSENKQIICNDCAAKYKYSQQWIYHCYNKKGCRKKIV